MIIDSQFLIFAGLAVVIVGALFYAFFYQSLQTQKKASQRMKSFQVDRSTKLKEKSRRVDEKARRKMREESLKNVDAQREKGKAVDKPPLSVRIAQAGMTMSVRQYYMMCVAIGIGVFFVMLLFAPVPFWISAGGAFVAAVGVPYWLVNSKRKKRFKKFTMEFPNAVDVIVRGIKSGLPLNDCIRIIANDAEEPVRSEFLKVIEATQVGLSMPDACKRLYYDIPTPETNFFAIVIAIQSGAGGNLAEALNNLSSVLRDRRKMSDKIQAVSMEAKSSAGIIGSLPFVVAGLVSWASPGYLDPLFYTTTGHKILIICAFAMTFGIVVMKKMINFKF